MSSERLNKRDDLASDFNDPKSTVEVRPDTFPTHANADSLPRAITALEHPRYAAGEFGNRPCRDDDPSN